MMESKKRVEPREEDLARLAADQQDLMKVLNDHFSEEPEVFEVALYALSVLGINQEVQRGLMSRATELKGIAPEALHMMRRFDNGLTDNKFYLESYAAIRMQLTMDDIKLETLRDFIVQGEKTGEPQLFSQAKGILLSRYDVLTAIAFMWKGITFAEEFDKKMRITINIGPMFEDYFKSKGV